MAAGLKLLNRNASQRIALSLVDTMQIKYSLTHSSLSVITLSLLCSTALSRPLPIAGEVSDTWNLQLC